MINDNHVLQLCKNDSFGLDCFYWGRKLSNAVLQILALKERKSRLERFAKHFFVATPEFVKPDTFLHACIRLIREQITSISLGGKKDKDGWKERNSGIHPHVPKEGK